MIINQFPISHLSLGPLQSPLLTSCCDINHLCKVNDGFSLHITMENSGKLKSMANEA